MKTHSAGLVVHRKNAGRGLEVFLVHPGGPFWAKKDAQAWSIPKGEIEAGEEPFAVALREFTEETGQTVAGTFMALSPCPQPGGKVVHTWAVEGEVDPARLVSSTFELEWPPRSGRRQAFPEVDRGAWFTPAEAREKLHRGQVPILDELCRRLGA
jgi:predicted NUDIX family NTP pyrophosphohydrolase